jgi:hypothetical protein
VTWDVGDLEDERTPGRRLGFEANAYYRSPLCVLTCLPLLMEAVWKSSRLPDSGRNGCGPGRRPADSGQDGHGGQRGAVGGRGSGVLPPGGDGPRGWIQRVTDKKMMAKLKQVKAEMMRRRHLPVSEQGRWLA